MSIWHIATCSSFLFTLFLFVTVPQACKTGVYVVVARRVWGKKDESAIAPETFFSCTKDTFLCTNEARNEPRGTRRGMVLARSPFTTGHDEQFLLPLGPLLDREECVDIWRSWMRFMVCNVGGEQLWTNREGFPMPGYSYFSGYTILQFESSRWLATLVRFRKMADSLRMVSVRSWEFSVEDLATDKRDREEGISP